MSSISIPALPTTVANKIDIPMEARIQVIHGWHSSLITKSAQWHDTSWTSDLTIPAAKPAGFLKARYVLLIFSTWYPHNRSSEEELTLLIQVLSHCRILRYFFFPSGVLGPLSLLSHITSLGSKLIATCLGEHHWAWPEPLSQPRAEFQSKERRKHSIEKKGEDQTQKSGQTRMLGSPTGNYSLVEKYLK